MLPEKSFPIKKQVVKIHGIQLPLPLAIPFGNGPDVIQKFIEERISLQDELINRPPGVYGQSQQVFQNLSSGKSGPFGVDLQVGDAGLHQAFRVFPVEDRIIGLITHQRGMSSEDAVPNVMEGPSPHSSTYSPHGRNEEFHPVEHLSGSLIGKGN
jgi:hypothetical protein